MQQRATRQTQRGSKSVVSKATNPVSAVALQNPGTPEEALRAKKARNKASTARNWAKVENYLMEVERAQGYAKSWALRERLEQGEVCLDDLKRR